MMHGALTLVLALALSLAQIDEQNPEGDNKGNFLRNILNNHPYVNFLKNKKK
jgi:hypothetical protein